ncbi:MAG: type III-B CRISPR module-associated protein Cmr5 [bacterium]
MNYTIPEIKIAQRATEVLEPIRNEIEKEKDFWGFIKGLPSMIVQDGLVQTLTFIKAKSDEKKKDKYFKIYRAFETYGKDLFNGEENFNLIRYLIQESIELEHYLYCQDRMLQFAIWLKRLGLALYADPSAR